PTPNTNELAFFVVIVSDGSPATPVALLRTADAPPASVVAAPVKPTTVIEAAPVLFVIAVTDVGACAAVAKAYHTSDVPDCALSCAARVHVNAGTLVMMSTFWRAVAGAPGPTGGPSAEMNATSSVFAATGNTGLVTVVPLPGIARTVLETDVAIVGGVPVETTSATALPPAMLDPAAGVWLMTLPFGTVALGPNVMPPTVRPAPVSDVVAAA